MDTYTCMLTFSASNWRILEATWLVTVQFDNAINDYKKMVTISAQISLSV